MFLFLDSDTFFGYETPNSKNYIQTTITQPCLLSNVLPDSYKPKHQIFLSISSFKFSHFFNFQIQTPVVPIHGTRNFVQHLMHYLLPIPDYESCPTTDVVTYRNHFGLSEKGQFAVHESLITCC